jgi:hypothetical protein
MKTQFTETQSKNNCYPNCDKNAKPVCARAAPRLQSTTLGRRESRREADLFKPVVDGFLLYPPVSYFTTDPQIPFFFLDGGLGGVSKNSSKVVLSDPVLIDLRTVRYPQPVLVNNL